MKKFIIPLLMVAVVALVFAGCMPKAAPPAAPPPVAPPPAAPPPAAPPPAAPPPAPPPVAPAVPPEYQKLIDQGLVSPRLQLNPFGEDFAVKPDGTPYCFLDVAIFMGMEEIVNYSNMLKSLITRAGGEDTIFDCELNVDKQIAAIEDMLAVGETDALLGMPVDERALAPVIDRCAAAGIPFYAYTVDCYSDGTITYAHHDWLGPPGGAVGEYLAQVAEKENKQINVFVVWGLPYLQECKNRYAAFMAPIKDHPLFNFIESGDSQCSDELTAELVMDGFTAHPELNACWHMCGGQTGIVSGLRTIGRLLPPEDPNHVIVATCEANTVLVEAMDDGYIDATGSHGGWTQVDTVCKLAFTHLILGQPVPRDVPIPYFCLTREDIHTLDSDYARTFGAVYWAAMPKGQWDLWPVLDTTSFGVQTPTKAMRMELQGY